MKKMGTWSVRRKKCNWLMTKTLVPIVWASLSYFFYMKLVKIVLNGGDVITVQGNGERGCGTLWSIHGPVKLQGHPKILFF